VLQYWYRFVLESSIISPETWGKSMSWVTVPKVFVKRAVLTQVESELGQFDFSCYHWLDKCWSYKEVEIAKPYRHDRIALKHVPVTQENLRFIVLIIGLVHGPFFPSRKFKVLYPQLIRDWILPCTTGSTCIFWLCTNENSNEKSWSLDILYGQGLIKSGTILIANYGMPAVKSKPPTHDAYKHYEYL
jgi:hypothetical protein